ncbi:MAG TPA: SET domain-containing protein-lysine N-methyltransferase [Nevskiaceae bacterium]|nr:SET domain-containing protein-lysine N-methyltransferase [Nevskiaceae bacterium]
MFAARRIKRGERIAQYRGKVMTHAQADRRPGNDESTGHTFLFTLNERYVIDGAQGGNIARWINHSCAPNCEPVHLEDEDDPRQDQIVIEAIRDIEAGEELGYDYGIPVEGRVTAEEKKAWACHCGARRCKGTMLRRW